VSRSRRTGARAPTGRWAGRSGGGRAIGAGLGLRLVAGGGDVRTIEVRGQPNAPVDLAPLVEPPPGELVSYRWELVRAPDTSLSQAPTVDAPFATFTPDQRGLYRIDRWVEAGLAEDLTHHFAVSVEGYPPIARILEEPEVRAGETARLDGAASESPEGYPLTYRWRLVAIPSGSQTTLSIADRVEVEVPTDLPGTYRLELDVFDGDLWSVQPARGYVRATAP